MYSLARKLRLVKHVIACLTALFSWTIPMNGQGFMPNADFGGFAGVSYYFGDINPRKQFYEPGLSLGALLKHNLTEHHSLRVNVFWGQLKGNDIDFKNEYQQMRSFSFETTLLDCHIGYEFNFTPYIVNRRVISHTTYIFGAIGYSIILSSSTDMASNHLTLPFGVGYKYRFNERVTLGCEWGLRKAFSDTIDGLLNPGPDGSGKLTHNNDWYSFVGLYLTFRVFVKGSVCLGLKEPKTYPKYNGR